MSSSSVSLTSLLKQTTIEDHEEVLKACNIALRHSKGDLEVLHVKLVALLKLDRFEDALRVLDEGGDTLRQRAQFEQAYAFYKNGDLEDAKRAAGSIGDRRGARHVEAQAVSSAGWRLCGEIVR